jgi:type VI secretion system protein ImpH
MASAPRATTDHLTPLEALRSDPRRFSLFAALRLLEQTYSASPRLGDARKAGDEVLRLGHTPHLTFATSDVADYEETARGGRLEQHSFGLFGPNGPLPVHLTELAFERRHHAEDATVIDFLNIFQHRLISLFYRAWANSDPATSFDRPASDRFAMYVGAVFGLAPDPARDRDGVPDHAKLYRAGRFSQQTRSGEGLEAILSDYFDVQAVVREFCGAWLAAPRELRLRLGRDADAATLGEGAFLGRATWQCQHKFEMVLGPVSLERLETFLPGRHGLRELSALVRLYTNDEWTWQLRLLLLPADIPGIRLGTAGRLGWTTWLGTRAGIADDVVIQGK